MYNQSEILEMKELMRDNYYRCLALNTEAEIDGIVYECKDQEIIAVKVANDATEAAISKVFTHVAGNAFEDCRYLRKLTWDTPCIDMGRFYNSYANLHIEGDDVRFAENTTTMAFLAAKGVTEVNIPNCTKLSNYAFYHYMDLKILRAKAEFIGDYGLAYCRNLTHFDFSHVKVFGGHACEGVEGIEFADLSSVEKIDAFTFYGCPRLARIKLSSNCRFVADNAFAECKNLRIVEFTGTQLEWYKLSKNLRRWRGNMTDVEYRKNRLRVKFVKDAEKGDIGEH